MLIGKRIKDMRLEKGMSQQELGDLIGVTKVSICGYEKETRDPNMETFIKLLDVLDVSPDYLLGRDVDVVCEEEPSYVKKMSKQDLEIIKELKKYPNLYKNLCNDLNRTVEKINKKYI